MRRMLLASLCLVSVATFAHADTIVSYNLGGAAGDQAFQAPDVQAANTSGFNLTRGSGLTASAAGNSFSSAGWESATEAPTSTEYMEFGFSVATGYFAQLDDLYIGTRSSNTGPGTIGLFSSIDGYTSPIVTIGQPGSTFVNSIIDLSVLGPIAGDLRFRLYEIGNNDAVPPGSTASTGTFRTTAYFVGGVFDRDFQITGTVSAVPEVSPLMLGAVGAGLYLLTIRLRHRRFAAK